MNSSNMKGIAGRNVVKIAQAAIEPSPGDTDVKISAKELKNCVDTAPHQSSAQANFVFVQEQLVRYRTIIGSASRICLCDIHAILSHIFGILVNLATEVVVGGPGFIHRQGRQGLTDLLPPS